MIGVKSKVLDPETCTVVVKDITLGDHDLFVSLSAFDAQGQMLNSSLLRLSDIQGVFPFTSQFTNPFLKQIEGEDSWLQELYLTMFQIRSNSN